MVTKNNSTSTSLKDEEINLQAFSLLMAAKVFAQSTLSTRINQCKTLSDKVFILRENVRVTDFLCNTITWLGEKQWNQQIRTKNGHGATSLGHVGNPPKYDSEHSELDHLLPSEFIKIRHRVGQLNDRLNGISAVGV